MAAQPQQLGRFVGCRYVRLAGDLVEFFLPKVRCQLPGFTLRPVIVEHDRLPQLLAPAVDGNKGDPLAGDAQGNDLLEIPARLRGHDGEALLASVPVSWHVDLGPAVLAAAGGAIDRGAGQQPRFVIDQSGLDLGGSGFDTE